MSSHDDGRSRCFLQRGGRSASLSQEWMGFYPAKHLGAAWVWEVNDPGLVYKETLSGVRRA